MIQTNYTLTIVRILACILIIWNHLSNNMLDGFLNRWWWSNIGVQIFFFMSGYLYGGREIGNRKEWMIKQTKKIVKPYYLSLLILIPLVIILDNNSLNILNITSAILCVQGFGPQINGLGQHWFISYILVCYLFTAIILSRLKLKKIDGRKFWLFFLLATVALQVLTIPLAILIHFKSAYIMTFVIGYCYKVRFSDMKNIKEKNIWESIIVIAALLGIAIRYFLENNDFQGLYQDMSDMTKQYIKLIWACAIFVIINHWIPQKVWDGVSDSVKQKFVVLAGCTYEIYLVHEFFVHEPYISLFGDINIIYKILMSLLAIAIATIVLCQLEKFIQKKTYNASGNK